MTPHFASLRTRIIWFVAAAAAAAAILEAGVALAERRVAAVAIWSVGALLISGLAGLVENVKGTEVD